MVCLKQDRYPRTMPKWQADAITDQGITVVYPDDVTPTPTGHQSLEMTTHAIRHNPESGADRAAQ